jgi:(R,R)-butanediol dehydrogenase/meso-butanediol dehydrogenase/diacetyl reductase
MRAVVLAEDRPRLETADVEDPVAGPGEVVVDVTACGVCGSDLHVVGAVAPPGTVLGHEVAGVVAEVGPEVDDRWRPGTVVTARPFFGCGSCAHCRRGRQDHCPEFRLVGLQARGGFAERTVFDATELFALPASVTGPEQSLVEPFAVARRTLRRGGLVAGEDVTVLGAGPIGLATVAWARALGAGRIVVSDPVERRRQLALAHGADVAVEPAAVEAPGGGGGVAPLVVECTGVGGLIDQAMRLAAIDGRVAVVGVCLAVDSIFPWWGLQKELDVRFAMYYGREDFTDTIDAFADHRIDAGLTVTETVGLDGLPARFAELLASPDAGKVVVVP